MEKDKLIEEMLKDIGDKNNTIDLAAYGRGLIDMFERVKTGNSSQGIVSHSGFEKPPLGLKPKWIHDQQRQGEIMAAINRYLEAGKTPPKEWVIEFASYCS